VDRENKHKDLTIQGGAVPISLLRRGHIARKLGFITRTKDAKGEPLKAPVKETVWQHLPVVRIDESRMRIGFGCTVPNPEMVETLIPNDQRRLRGLAACGARHPDLTRSPGVATAEPGATSHAVREPTACSSGSASRALGWTGLS